MLLALLLGGAVAAIVVAKLAVRRARYLTRDPRRIAAACRQELADYLVDQHIDAARSATLHELGALVRHELAVETDGFVAAATAARFGRPAGAGSAARDARRELRALTRAHARAHPRARPCARDRLAALVRARALMQARRDGGGRGVAPPPADRALAEADPADRRRPVIATLLRELAAAGCERVVRRHGPSRGAGRGARRRRLGLRARGPVRAPARRARLGGRGAARARRGRGAAAPRDGGRHGLHARVTSSGSSRRARGAAGALAYRLEPAPDPPHRDAVRVVDGRVERVLDDDPANPNCGRAALAARPGARAAISTGCPGRRPSSPARFQRGDRRRPRDCRHRDRDDAGLDASGGFGKGELPLPGVMSETTYSLFQQGRAQLKRGMAAQATVALEKAKEREPEKASIREALGIAYFRIRRWDAAEAEFRKLLDLSPVNDYAHYALGRTLEKQGRAREANVHYKLAARSRPARRSTGRGSKSSTTSSRDAGGLPARVASPRVRVGGEVVGEIGPGLCVLLGIARGDARDASGWPARSRGCGSSPTRRAASTGACSTRAARRSSSRSSRCSPTRTRATGRASATRRAPEEAEPLYEQFCADLAALGVPVARGVFGATMAVELVNDGPVTIVL